MDISRLLNTPPRRRFPSEILETPQLSTQSLPLSQLLTQSWDSQNGPRPSRESSLASESSQSNLPQTPKREYAPTLTRSDRIRIKTAFDFNHCPESIHKKYGYTISQIERTRHSRLTPQVHRRGRKPFINTPTRHSMEQWFLKSPSRRHIAFKHIPALAPPELGLQGYGEQAIRTAFKLVGYGRRVAKRKGFLDDPEVMNKRLTFAQIAINWTVERLF